MLELKIYQRNAIDKVNEFLSSALVKGAERAFQEIKVAPGLPTPRYETYDLGNIPYFCLRIPTGGGKTLLASYCIREATQVYMHKANPLVMWLVPTTAILNQTINALNKPRHPYREALEEYFGSNLLIFDISQVNTIKPQDLRDNCCIVVGTIASLRVSSTEGRLVYGHDEAFDNHFVSLPDNIEGMELEDGKIKRSYANICYLNEPLIIMDEAHNARTPLSFEFLKRLNPSVIIELTATPNLTPVNGSNILYSVSALELKHEQMIKLPIILTEHNNWEQAVASTVLLQSQLADIAKTENEYIRPIALYQAEHKDQEITWEILKTHLIEQEKISPDKIAVATGDEKGLKDIDLFSPDCKIEHIITVEALKEGWDCSFAYIFCTMSSRTSSKDVEQILGRILRMPYARSRKNETLNYAYAHIASPTFSQAATNLKDAMVNKLGFEKQEVQQFVIPPEGSKGNSDEPSIFDEPVSVDVTVSEVNQEVMDSSLTDNLEVNTTNEQITLTIRGDVTQEKEELILKTVPEADRQKVRKAINRLRNPIIAPVTIQKKESKPFKVPRLVFNHKDEILFLDSSDFLDFGNWTLIRFQAVLPMFKISEDANVWTIDINEKDKVTLGHDRKLPEINFNLKVDGWNENELIVWLDENVEHTDITLAEMTEFLRKLIQNLININHIPLAHLVKARFILANEVKKLVETYRQLARKEGYQSIIDIENKHLATNFQYAFSFNPDISTYPAKPPYYEGDLQLKKHFYTIISNMNGEEKTCAHALDIHPKVKCWVRNIERYPETSFWLPTSTDKFYPDFIAELTDGRILAVEYKGEQLKTTDDTDEKTTIGYIWQQKSKGKGLFLMAFKKDAHGNDVYRQIQDKLM